MRPATRILARTGPLSVRAATPSAVVQAPGQGGTRSDLPAPVPAPPSGPDLDLALGDFVRAIDNQLEVLDALVSATQDQLKTIISLKGLGLEGTPPSDPTPLADVQNAIAVLSTRLGIAGDRVHETARTLHKALGVTDEPTEGELTLSTLVNRVPEPKRDAAAERVSALKSLAQALSELQRVSLVHANRGLQAIAAWRTVLGMAENEPGLTYTRAGRSKSRGPTQATRLEVEL